MHVVRTVYRRRWTNPIVGTIGTSIMLWGILGDGVLSTSDVRSLGAVLVVTAGVRSGYRAYAAPQAEMHEQGRRLGFEAGRREERRTSSRLKLVPSYQDETEVQAASRQ